MNIPDEAVRAAASAMLGPGEKRDEHGTCDGCAQGTTLVWRCADTEADLCDRCCEEAVTDARVALTAAYPLIVAQVAEQIAQAIQGVECRITDEYDVGLQEGLVRGQRVARSFKDAR